MGDMAQWLYREYQNLNKEVRVCSNCDIAFPIEHHLVSNINGTCFMSYETDVSIYRFCPFCGEKMTESE